jgi:hypothetical protein
MSILYKFDPETFMYLGKLLPEEQQGDELNVTQVVPPYNDFRFNIKWYPAENTWSYVENKAFSGQIQPPGVISEYEAVLTYKYIRDFQYPPYTDYLDGIVKGDEEQVALYIQKCKDVKLRWPKDTPDMTMREYWIQIGKIRID